METVVAENPLSFATSRIVTIGFSAEYPADALPSQKIRSVIAGFLCQPSQRESPSEQPLSKRPYHTRPTRVSPPRHLPNNEKGSSHTTKWPCKDCRAFSVSPDPLPTPDPRGRYAQDRAAQSASRTFPAHPRACRWWSS